MKVNILVLMISFVLFACSTDNIIKTEENPCPSWQIIVKTKQDIKLTNSIGQWQSEIDYKNLSLIATDSQWNYQYAPNGNLIADKPNYVEVQKEFNENNEITRLVLELGHVYENKAENSAIGYFLLKLDENNFDKIIGYYDISCGNLLLKLFKLI